MPTRHNSPVRLTSLHSGEYSNEEVSKMGDEVVWDTLTLMGTGVEGGGADAAKEDPLLWGLPGYLTQEECDNYFLFKEEVATRGDDVKKTVYSFGEVEGEAYTLLRWLRARKFVLEDTVKMIEEATECHKGPRENDYYANPVDALGCEVSLYFAQYPQLYTGKAMNGAPIFISKPGVLNTDAVECITTLGGILKFHWYIEMHDFGNLLRTEKEKNPAFTNFQCFSILDLGNLAASQMTKRALAIIKEQAAVDSLCFPETMSKMIIINAPRFFAASWRLIKGWLDPRTASKIEVFSNKAQATKKLLELVNEDQLPVDYGGTGPDTTETLRNQILGECTKLHSEILHLRGSGNVHLEVGAGEFVEVQVWTRCTAGAAFSIYDFHDKKKNLLQKVEVKHEGTGTDENEKPTCTTITTERIAGPVHMRVRADAHASRFHANNFLVVYYIFPTPR